MDNGQLTFSIAERAEALNNCFKDVFTVERDIDPRIATEQMRPESVCQVLEISRDDVLRKLSKLKQWKSGGPDGIHPKLLYEMKDELAAPLASLFSKSLLTGDLPGIWRKASVTPIFKKGQRSEPGNYRLVSLTCILCKLMEGLIRDHITQHLIDNNLLSDSQFGFRKGRSCSLQLLQTMDHWMDAWDRGHEVDVAFLDFRKAFDTVPHKRLLQKVAYFGIQGLILTWIQEILLGRVQRVVLGEHYSEWVQVSSGVPQGSVLGPLLFLLYVNDIPERLSSTVRLFAADDAKIYRSIKTEVDYLALQQDMTRVCEWCHEWQMKLNLSKCKVMTIKPGPADRLYLLRQDSTEVQCAACDSEKDLGVIIDSQLKFESHIREKVAKANRVVGLMF
jgi:hypothetical protein